MQRVIHILLVVSVVIIGIAILLPIMASSNEARFARLAARYLDERRTIALSSDLAGAARELKIMADFRTGKVRRDSEPGKSLEKHRSDVITEVIARMRALSGEDLGSDPQSWIKKYYKPRDLQPSLLLQATPGRALVLSQPLSQARRL